MACATLKRRLELDPICARATKRRRFNLLTPATPTKEKEPSPFAAMTPRINSSMDQISISIQEEMKRLHRRKKLYYVPEPERAGAGEGSCSSSPAGAADLLAIDTPESPFSQQTNTKQDKHLFTFRQVGMICERLLKDREDSLRELYDEILNAKLAEQYDTFVKFTYDQIQKKFDNSAAPSYLS